MHFRVTMPRFLRLGFTVVLLALATSSCAMLPWLREPAIDANVISFNIRQGHGKDGENRWELRKDLVAEVMREQAPDIMGLQEVYHFQLDYLLEELPQYGALGVGREGGIHGEYSPILYLKERFEVLDYGTFWLSGTPALPSATWGNRYKRLCTWARLKDLRVERSFYIYNTHLDHESQTARQKSVELIMERITARDPADPFLFCGDLNAGEDSRLIGYLKGHASFSGENPVPLIDSWRVVHPHNPENGTVSRFTGSLERYKIDYILVTPRTRVMEAEILRSHREDRYPSDHYPVSARLHLR